MVETTHWTPCWASQDLKKHVLAHHSPLCQDNVRSLF